jgi:hypothetical protein
MEGNPLGNRPLPLVQRTFALSRLAHEAMAVAYELLLPPEELTAGRHDPSAQGRPRPSSSRPQQPLSTGGCQ